MHSSNSFEQESINIKVLHKSSSQSNHTCNLKRQESSEIKETRTGAREAGETYNENIAKGEQDKYTGLKED